MCVSLKRQIRVSEQILPRKKYPGERPVTSSPLHTFHFSLQHIRIEGGGRIVGDDDVDADRDLVAVGLLRLGGTAPDLCH